MSALSEARAQVVALQTRIRDRDAKDLVPAFDRHAGYVHDELLRAGFLQGDPWKLRDSVYQHNFTEALRKGTA